MIDPEISRLRRLRSEALRVREIARALGETRWATDDTLLARGACTGWRIARVVSGRLKAHPYLRYQQGVGVGSLLRNRLVASYQALLSTDRVRGLRRYESELHALARQLNDTRALSWATDFSDTLGRSQLEIASLLADVAQITKSAVPVLDSLPKRLPRSDTRAGELAQTIEGDWPYLAF